MVQDVLAEPEWPDVLGDADRRGLTPLFTSNMTPYGDIQLDTSRRLAIGGTAVEQQVEPSTPYDSSGHPPVSKPRFCDSRAGDCGHQHRPRSPRLKI